MTTATVPRTLFATVRYEAVMAGRARVLWWALVPLTALAVLLATTSPNVVGSAEPVARVANTAILFAMLCTLGVAIGLTDRFVGHRRSGLTDLLDATAAGGTVRLVGALLGALAVAMAVPVGAFLVLVVITALSAGSGAVLGAGVVAVVTILLPAGLVLSTFTALLGVLVPPAVARVLTVLAWMWATVLSPALVPIPTITGTVLSPLGHYPAAAWLHESQAAATYGLDGALRPAVTTGSALLALLVALAASAVFLALTRIRLALAR
ncbi:MAG TPA: hypothetical protein VGJ13_15400 [Pseudonocardiaceae bacterium]|jgi:ABC-2 type transport system permease protein